MTEHAAKPASFFHRFIASKLIYWVLLLAGLSADIATKAWAERMLNPEVNGGGPSKIVVIEGFLAWEWATNLGAAFSLLSGRVEVLSTIGFIVLIAILVYVYRTEPKHMFFLFCLGCVSAGAIGNLHDRLLLGHVRDFILFDFDLPGHTWQITLPWNSAPTTPIPKRWPVFNVADMLVLTGVAGLIVINLFTPDPRKAKSEQQPGA